MKRLKRLMRSGWAASVLSSVALCLVIAGCAGATEEGFGVSDNEGFGTPATEGFETPPPSSPQTVAPVPRATPMATATPLPTATPMAATPMATATPLTTATAVAATPMATATPVAADTSEGSSRAMGEYEGVTFVVSEGSEATFTVTEKLARLSLPNDAVMRTTSLTGEVRLDGGASSIALDLHSMTSDQGNRDRYVRTRMFGDYPTATFTVPSVSELPDGFADGEEVEAEVEGSLEIRGITVPLVFEIEARDDGDRVFILGRTTFTWQDMEITPPVVGPVQSIEDEVRVEVLLSVEP